MLVIFNDVVNLIKMSLQSQNKAKNLLAVHELG